MVGLRFSDTILPAENILREGNPFNARAQQK
jgi:hypothetical protein